MMAVFEAESVDESRRYLDSIEISFPEASGLRITPVVEGKFRGGWFGSPDADGGVTLLYFHGGGYSFYPKAYTHIIALITQAAKSRTFALDYSLAPEHRYPTQLEEALHAYRWLLESGVDPDRLVLAGDSAGGNLALALLLAVRDSNLPLPKLAIALSPPTDFEAEWPSLDRNEDSDWIDKRMLQKWADWFCGRQQRCDPAISLQRADLRGLPPIYIQAGGGEVLYDSIKDFADKARRDGANVVLESWEEMNHDFQIFGPYTPQSKEALRRIGELIESQVHGEPERVSPASAR
jgi:epsilon-lactone hydrolase